MNYYENPWEINQSPFYTDKVFIFDLFKSITNQ